MAWWSDHPTLAIVVTDILHGELTRLRPGAALPERPWPAHMQIGQGGLECDSLEKLSLAAALGRTLRLDRSGLEDHLLARQTVSSWIELARLCLSQADESLVFASSGSTGEPKPCEHALSVLEQEVAFLAGLFSGRRRIVSAVSSRHIYGFLFTVLLPLELGVPLHRRIDKSTVGLAGDLLPGDLIIGFPDFWRLAAGSARPFPPDVDGVTSTAPFPAALAPSLVRLGVRQLTEIYGSSETAGLGWRFDPAASFRLFPYWSHPNDGKTRTITRIRPDGSLTGYELPDLLDWTGDGEFRVQGRRDEAFQVAGSNVYPARIAAILEGHPSVAAASVRRMRPEEGDRVKAFIVPASPEESREGLAQVLASWVNETLTPAERPKSFCFGTQLPRDALGKSVDWDIARPEHDY